MAQTYKGLFKARHPEKYAGDPTKIIYRSGWEAKTMAWLDNHPNVIRWGSEEVVVPYKSPLDGKIRRYFPDFVVTFKDKDGKISTRMLEVKPKKQTIEPKVQKARTKKYITEVATWSINKAKWDAAERFCNERGWTFHVITEKEIFG
jgi:hypothetical protein